MIRPELQSMHDAILCLGFIHKYMELHEECAKCPSGFLACHRNGTPRIENGMPPLVKTPRTPPEVRGSSRNTPGANSPRWPIESNLMMFHTPRQPNDAGVDTEVSWSSESENESRVISNGSGWEPSTRVTSFPLHAVWNASSSKEFACNEAISSLSSCNSRAKSTYSNTKSWHSRPSARVLLTSGSIQSTTSHSAALCNAVIFPNSWGRIAWDILAILWLLFDVVTVPIGLIESSARDNLVIARACAGIFWTLDIVLSMRTGVFIGGLLITDARKIRQHYFRTWFCLDVSMVAVDWTSLTMRATMGGAQTTPLARLARFVRFAKFLRLVKAEAIILKLAEGYNGSFAIVMVVRMSIYFMAFLSGIHILACVWYDLGNGAGPNGWLNYHQYNEGNTTFSSYVTAFHFVLSCFHGTTEITPRSLDERIFAVIVSCFGVFAVSWLMGTMTNLMMQLQRRSKEWNDNKYALEQFFRERSVSPGTAVQVKAFLKEQRRSSILLEGSVVLLASVPVAMRRTIHEEVRLPFLVSHHYFCSMFDADSKFMETIAHEAMFEMAPSRLEQIFRAGDSCSKLYIMTRGKLEYHHSLRNSTSETVESRELICEVVIWTMWIHCGDLVASQEGLLYGVFSEKFLEMVCDYENAYSASQKFAVNFVEYLRQCDPESLHDMISSEDVPEAPLAFQCYQRQISPHSSISPHSCGTQEYD